MHIQFSPEEIGHFLLPRENVIESFVVENEGTITDFMSFYSLPSSILKHPQYSILNVAYSYYNVANTVDLRDLLNTTLSIAKEKGYDVFNMLDIMENEPVVKDLNFGVGDGNLHYYLYNWRVNKLNVKELGMVLV